jgi:hydroxylysine kinase
MNANPLSGLLSASPPTVDDNILGALAQTHFGISGAMKRLTSERDLNVQITTSTQSYVLKLTNPAESREVTDFQTKALLHLEPSGLPVPRVMRTMSGATEAALPNGILRLLTYLDGTPMHLSPRTAEQTRAMGHMAARLTLGLSGFSHPASDHVLQWDIKQAAALRPLLPAIADDGLRCLATQTLNHFDIEVAPHLPDLRWQVVHNDLNPHNVLTAPGNPDAIAGVLDFGDMVRTPLICDAAIAASYQIDPTAPLESLLNFARAYHAILPLTELEAQLFPALIATRMLTTLAIASTRAARYPENAPYILRNVPTARDGLMALASLDPETTRIAMETL